MKKAIIKMLSILCVGLMIVSSAGESIYAASYSNPKQQVSVQAKSSKKVTTKKATNKKSSTKKTTVKKQTKKHNTTGCGAVGSAGGLGVPWRYPGRGKVKRRKALRRLRLRGFLRLPKTA